jgi:hypothetical protein
MANGGARVMPLRYELLAALIGGGTTFLICWLIVRFA